MSEKYYLYCHTNLINGKRYFGITHRQPEKRWGNNGCNYKSSPHFFAAIQKYGWDNFKHEILFERNDKRDVEMLEREHILKYQTWKPEYGYNIELGGNYEGTHSDATRKKISESKIGKPRSEETKQKVSRGLMGKMTGRKNGMSKPVICVTTGVVYESQGLASKATGIQQSDISKCCNGVIKSAGKSETGERLVWQYYDENED